MDERAKKLLNEKGGLSFTDDDLPPDPMGEVREFDSAAVEQDMREILRYAKEREAEGYLVYRKEMEMITQDTDENIDEAIRRLKDEREIYEPEVNAFRPVLGTTRTRKHAQKENVSKGHGSTISARERKQKEAKKMSEKIDKFGDETDSGKEKGKDEGEVYNLTMEDMPTQMFDGERISMDDILDKDIIIRDMVTRPSSFSEGDYAILQVEKDGEPYVALTGSVVLLRQIKEKADKLPFRCKIVEQQSTRSKYRYYTLAPVVKE
jgi:hypothetical protein